MTMPSAPRPLDGVTIVWTGSEGSGTGIIRLLEAEGACVSSRPLIETRPRPERARVLEAVSADNSVDWVVVSSAKAAALMPSPPATFR